jgi:broad specificity phosphatase PhoE
MATKKELRALVLRHGDTDANDSNVFRGMLDPGLNDEGVLDAHRAAQFLKKFQIERIIASPLLRAIETAEICSGALGGLAIRQDRALLPWQMGPEFYGKDRQDLKSRLDHFIDHPDEEPENGQALNAFIQRVGDFFEYQLSLPSLTLYVTHTSDVISLTDLINNTVDGRPEQGEVVAPGGICGVYVEDEGYSIEPIFGHEKKAEFGTS